MWWLITLHLILVHSVGGQEIHLNIEEISSIREPSESGDAADLLTHDVNCIVGMANGKFVTTKETCKEVILLLAEYDKMEKQEAEERLKHVLHDDL